MKRIANEWLTSKDGEMVKAEVFVRYRESEEVESILEQLGIGNYTVVVFYEFKNQKMSTTIN